MRYVFFNIPLDSGAHIRNFLQRICVSFQKLKRLNICLCCLLAELNQSQIQPIILYKFKKNILHTIYFVHVPPSSISQIFLTHPSQGTFSLALKNNIQEHMQKQNNKQTRKPQSQKLLNNQKINKKKHEHKRKIPLSLLVGQPLLGMRPS